MNAPICPTHGKEMRWWEKGKVYTCPTPTGTDPTGKTIFCQYRDQGANPVPAPAPVRAAAGPGVSASGDTSPADRVAALNFAARIYQSTQDPDAALIAAQVALQFLRG